jgi:hypothetical protein
MDYVKTLRCDGSETRRRSARSAVISRFPAFLALMALSTSACSTGSNGGGPGGPSPGRAGSGGSVSGGTGGRGGSGPVTGGTGGTGGSSTGGSSSGGAGGSSSPSPDVLPDPPAGGDAASGNDVGEGGLPPVAGADQPPPCKQMVPVSDAAALTPALAAAMPGDCLMLADGAYGALTISAKGTAEAPVQVRAVNLLKASAGALRFDKAEHAIVHGLALSTILFVNSNYSRVTRCQVRGPSSGYWVRVEEQKGCMNGCNNDPPGTSKAARIDHCDIGGGNSSSDIFNPTAFSTGTRIDHNYIHDTTGPHLMTLGCCGAKYDYFESGTIVENNLFVNANGTSAEMISIKGAGVHFRYNTIRAHRGDIDIRAGRNNAIYGNYILGPGPGIRMYEDNHRIYNNYVNGGLSGNQSGPIHAPVKNATVVFNTFTGNIALAGGAGNVSANNIVLGGGGGGMGNLGGPAEALGLVRMGDILTITAGSRAVGAAVGSYPFVTDDISGFPRGAKLDVGAQQLSTGTPLRKVLTTADVGPMAP